MGKYQSYKPTGVEWIGEIPEHWKKCRLKNVSKSVNGYSFKSDDFDKEYDIPVIRIGDVGDKIDFEDCIKVKSDFLTDKKDFVVFRNDILIGLTGGTIGKSGRYNYDTPSLLNQRVGLLRNNKDLLNGLLYYYVKSEVFIRYIYFDCYGGGQDNISMNDILKMVFPLPPLQEQHQIVEFLDEKTELIDKLISTKERKITLLKEQRTTLINQVITKGLNPNVKMKDSGVEWIGEIPEDWDFGKLKYFTTLVTDGSHFSPEVIDEGRFYISVTDITKDNRINFDDCKKISNESFEELERNGCRPQIGDILVTKDGTIGRGCVVNDLNDFVILSSLGLIRVKPQHSNKYFLYYLLSGLNIDQMYSHIRGSGITRLTIKLINDLIVVIPTISEQHKIVEYLDSNTKEIDDLVQLEQKKIDLLKEYRQSLISEVVTGKIKVTN